MRNVVRYRGSLIAVGGPVGRIKLWAESGDPEDLADPKPAPGLERLCTACGGRNPGLRMVCGYCRWEAKRHRMHARKDVQLSPSAPAEDREARIAAMAERAAAGLPVTG